MRRLEFLSWFILALAISPGARAHGQEEGEEEALSGNEEEYYYQEEEAIRAALKETLAQPEFARLRPEPSRPEEAAGSAEAWDYPEWLDRTLERIARALWNDDEEDEKTAPSFPALNFPGARFLVYAMAFLVLGTALFFVLRSALSISRDRRRSEEEASRSFGPESAPGELAPDDYWRRAISHGEARRYKEGMRELLLGAMSAIERRGAIRFRRGLTNRDYFHAVRGAPRDAFGIISSAFEYVYFGRREATADAFRDSCRAYEKSFREVPS
jgi:hypothetical protein